MRCDCSFFSILIELLVVYGYEQISIWGGTTGSDTVRMLDQKWHHQKSRDFSLYFFSVFFFRYLFPQYFFPPYFFPVLFQIILFLFPRTFFSRTFWYIFCELSIYNEVSWFHPLIFVFIQHLNHYFVDLLQFCYRCLR